MPEELCDPAAIVAVRSLQFAVVIEWKKEEIKMSTH